MTRYLTWPPHASVDQTRFVIGMWMEEYKKEDCFRFAIERKDSRELIGGIDVVDIDDGIPEIGYVLGKKHWGNGFMTEACSCMIEYLFSLGYPKIRIAADINNPSSNRVIQKVGGVLLGEEEMARPLKGDKVKIYSYIVERK